MLELFLEGIKAMNPATRVAIGGSAVVAYLGKTYYEKVNELNLQQQKLQFMQKEIELNRIIANQVDIIERLERDKKERRWF